MNAGPSPVLRRLMPVLVAALAAVALSACGAGGSSLTTSLDEDAGTDTGGEQDAGEQDTGGQQDTGTPQDTFTGIDTGDDPCLQTTGQQASTFAQDYATALCDVLMACSDNPKVVEIAGYSGWSSAAKCVESIKVDSISPGRAQAVVDAGTVAFDSCKAEECLQAVPAFDCARVHGILTEARWPQAAACYDAWVGGLIQGEACNVDAECDGFLVCARQANSGQCAGSCAVPSTQGGSGQCGTLTCDDDQYCHPDDSVCMLRAAEDEPCEDDFECELGTLCSDDTCSTTTTGLTEGEDCNGQDLVCDIGLTCVDGKCSNFLQEGDDCQLFGCDRHLFCQTGQCAPKMAAGESCTSDLGCVSQRCHDGACTAVGELCASE